MRAPAIGLMILAACGSPPSRPAGAPGATRADAAPAVAEPVPSDAGPPPELDCPAGAAIVRARPHERTAACVRPDGVRDGPFVVRFPDGSIAVQGTYAAGRLDGAWRRLHPDGAVAEEGAWKAGKKDGAWRQLAADGTEVATYEMDDGTGVELVAWDDGGPRREVGWKDGVRHGRSRAWDPGEVLLLDETWVDGALDGARTIGTRQGHRVVEQWTAGVRTGARTVSWKGDRLVEERFDAQGRRHGAYLTWRDEARKREEGRWSHGQRAGDWTWYGLSGNPEKQARFDGGLVDGVVIAFDRGGDELGRYTMKAGTGTATEYDRNGKRLSKTRWAQGVRQGPSTRYWPRGTVHERGAHDGGARDGVWTSTWPRGEARAEVGWRAGLLDGAVTRRRKDGAVETEATFTAGRRDGAFVERYADGAVLLAGEHRAGVPHGVWTQHRPDGTVAAQVTWKDGRLERDATSP